MCGRFVSRNQAAIERYFNIQKVRNPLVDRYNVNPTDDAPVIRMVDGELELAMMHWWLIPRWSKTRKIKYRTFNAVGETVDRAPAFRAPYRSQRCLIPVDGYYEWQKGLKPRPPHYVYRQDGAPMTFAGLWEHWERDGDSIFSCTIITTAPNTMLSRLNHSMPVVLDPNDFEWWMTGSPHEVKALLKPCPDDWIDFYRVPFTVNDPRNEGLELIERLKA